MKKNLLLIGSILGGFVSGCIAVFGIMLCLTGCSMNVAPTQMFEESTQNKIEWIVTDDESRAAETTLDYVTVEVYKAPVRDHKYIFYEKNLLTQLHYTEVKFFMYHHQKTTTISL